ncbi:hypothetical protein HOLleu_33296 [Holothuria leucospilota]|uniref:Uncharacterized protein n=1 Tax=Holothuria leucospilota TaxID=206669 RepID=A0A9Q0YNE6_HOLLE|nr:hypothetical protein HOLleu_33296 [Holothuria leucospilota]
MEIWWLPFRMEDGNLCHLHQQSQSMCTISNKTMTSLHWIQDEVQKDDDPAPGRRASVKSRLWINSGSNSCPVM